MCIALLCGDDSSHSQGQSGKRLLLAFRGHPARAPAYQGSCIDPTHLYHTLDPTPDLSIPITDITIRLLVNDSHYSDFRKHDDVLFFLVVIKGFLGKTTLYCTFRVIVFWQQAVFPDSMDLNTKCSTMFKQFLFSTKLYFKRCS